MFKKSENYNPNYLAKVVKLENLEKVENSDKLYKVLIDFQQLIVNDSQKEGDICVYFPTECAINKEFLSYTNSFRDKELNADKEEVGYFDKNGRSKTIKLRGEFSSGCLFPIDKVVSFLESKNKKNVSYEMGIEFDSFDDILICKKYVVKEYTPSTGGQKAKKASKIDSIVKEQFAFHVDTEQFRKNIHKIQPNDNITISYKVHGTSCITSHLLVNRNLSLVEKILDKSSSINKIKKYLPVIKKEDYGYIFASRRVIKAVEGEEVEDKEHFYDVDIWSVVGEELKSKVEKGITIYSEIVGYLPTNAMIQKDYDYGCVVGQHKVYVYRITYTNPDGKVFNYTTKECQEYCERYELEFVPVFYNGLAKDKYPELDTNKHWHEDFLHNLEKDYNEKNCYLCKKKVPEEGVVIRKENSYIDFEAYKLKSIKFLEKETKMLDKGEGNLEDEN